MKQNWSFISKNFNTDVSTSDNSGKREQPPKHGGRLLRESCFLCLCNNHRSDFGVV